jgi:hypothetical protein
MKAPLLLEKMCAQLHEAELDRWVAPVRTLYHTTYREAYEAGRGDCEERWTERQEDDDDDALGRD